jgi:hypothetical protein
MLIKAIADLFDGEADQNHPSDHPDARKYKVYTVSFFHGLRQSSAEMVRVGSLDLLHIAELIFVNIHAAYKQAIAVTVDPSCHVSPASLLEGVADDRE